MWFHLTFHLPDGVIRTSGLYGHLGVVVFFVISGFVIPYSIDLRDYHLGKDSWVFIGRRIIRVEPPYLVSVLLLLCVPYLAGLTPWFQSGVSAHDAYRATLHAFYIVPWTGEDWLNISYWSLAIEFQYYFFMVVAAPILLFAGNLWLQRVFLTFVIVVAYYSHETRLVFIYLPVFAFGFIQFLRTRRGMPLWECLVWAGVSLVATALTQELSWAIIAPIALLALNAQWPERCFPLLFLGTISYSLYLLHGPIGLGVDNLVSRIPGFPPMGNFSLQMVAAIFLSVLFWWLVERPSMRLSKSFGTLRTPVIAHH
jgi:peptidoglycan/LPS O-acetylase OafA/YrhL